jgi:HlyD family secretion protein
MRRRLIVVIVVLIAAVGAGAWWWFNRAGSADSTIVLYGNVEMRDVSVAFPDSGRIARVNVEEGNQVKQGDVIASLDTSRLMPMLAQAQAQVDAGTAALNKLKAGTRPEEIAQAKANANAAHANATNASLAYQRVTMLAASSGTSTVTQSQIDAAKAASDAAAAQADAADQAVNLAVAGPTAEDIAQAQAQLQASQAARDLIKQQLTDADLKAPTGGIISARLLEPGEIATPQRPVVSLAVVDPKWVRAYLSEADLARVKQGTVAAVTVDGVAMPLIGHVGFISPEAEFTPRAIQTEELRTSLVYEVRILVDDPGNLLRLGMPATVRIVPAASATPSGPATPAAPPIQSPIAPTAKN